MHNSASRFKTLENLSRQSSSEGRRELLRNATEALGVFRHTPAEVAEYDRLLAVLASDYSVQVRANLAKLVAKTDSLFTCAAQLFALDEIAVAGPVLKHSAVLSESTLLRVISEKSQDHLLAVTERKTISEQVSQALVEKGSDEVVAALLVNEGARIGAGTFEIVAARAQTSPRLQTPMVNRKDVPISLLNDMYVMVEAGLRREILRKIGSLSPADIEVAFRASRDSFTESHGDMPKDMPEATKRVDLLDGQGALVPPVLVKLLREGAIARTAFKVAFARLADVQYDLVQRVVESHDIDTIALLCRGADFDRALFVTLAIGLDSQNRAMGGAEAFGNLYESVPVLAAQRAIRFWRVRASA